MHSPQHNSTSNQISNPDVVVSHLGTLYTFCPLTLRAKEWIDEHVQDDALWFGHVMSSRTDSLGDWAQGITDDGLVLA